MRIIKAGSKFGRLMVLEILPLVAYSQKRAKVRCDCGTIKIIQVSSLPSGHTRSCGCLRKEETKKRLLVHGHAVRGKTSPEYCSWYGMIRRCNNPKNKSYRYYGGRGIKVCQRWKSSFVNFLADMGKKPSKKHSIDRINNDGNYGPGNCRWATKRQQVMNRGR